MKSTFIRSLAVIALIVASIAGWQLWSPISISKNMDSITTARADSVRIEKKNSTESEVTPSGSIPNDKPHDKQIMPTQSTDEKAKEDWNALQETAKICRESRDKHPKDLVSARKEAAKNLKLLPTVSDVYVDDKSINVTLKSGITVHYPFVNYNPERPTE